MASVSISFYFVSFPIIFVVWNLFQTLVSVSPKGILQTLGRIAWIYLLLWSMFGYCFKVLWYRIHAIQCEMFMYATKWETIPLSPYITVIFLKLWDSNTTLLLYILYMNWNMLVKWNIYVSIFLVVGVLHKWTIWNISTERIGQRI